MMFYAAPLDPPEGVELLEAQGLTANRDDAAARAWARRDDRDGAPPLVFSDGFPEWVQDCEEPSCARCHPMDPETGEIGPPMTFVGQFEMAAGMQFGDCGRAYVFECDECNHAVFFSQTT